MIRRYGVDLAKEKQVNKRKTGFVRGGRFIINNHGTEKEER
jgi:hypothetical protein